MSTGEVYSDPVARRADDAIAFAVCSAERSGRRIDALRRGTGHETYYRAQLTHRLTSTPDLQFIRHPGRRGSADDDEDSPR